MTELVRDRPTVAAPRSARVRLRNLPLYAVLVVVGLVIILPLLWMVSTALKSEGAVFSDSGLIPAAPTLENFDKILNPSGDAPVFRWMLNSVIVSGVGTLLSVGLVSMSAYAFARMEFPGKNALFALLIGTLLLPGALFVVPQFQVVNALGIYNTLPSLFLPGLAGAFGVFFMRQFFLGIPIEIEEAAWVDGASRFKTFRSVILPLSGPGIATLSVISFIAYWNDYLWPLVACEGEGCTLTPGLRNFQGQYTFEYGILMAGAVVAAVPVLIVYVIAQRWVIQSVVSSGVKG